jgi:aldehyde dehydrogenase (NAD+)
MSTLPNQSELATRAKEALEKCGVSSSGRLGSHKVLSPINGEELAALKWSELDDVERAVERANKDFLVWRSTPAPIRGALVKHFGALLQEHKEDIATLISLEVGKIKSEALGEVQEMIDICDFAIGLSRQLYGRTMPSERPGHRMM